MRSLVCGLLLVLAPMALAVERVSLYETERIIAQSAGESRQVEVVADALDEVLRRVSGLAQLPEHEALDAARERPIDLLSRFSLGESDETIPDAIGNPQPTYRLELIFESSLIHQILGAAEIPVWTERRPRSLVVLAAPDGQRIDLQPENSQVDAVTHLRDQARLSGLPLSWPLLDLEDTLLVSTDEVWGGFTEELLMLGERYQADAILAGYVGLQPDTGNWVGRWHYILGNQRTSSTYFGETQQEVVQRGVELATRVLSDRYGVLVGSDETHTHTFNVMNLGNMETHVAVRRYLRDVIGTDAVYMDSLNGDQASYRVTSAADETQWLDLLALEGRLQLVPTVAAFGESPRLEFVWRD